jgi:phosphomannomutase
MGGSGAISIRQDHHICGAYDETFSSRDIYRFGLYVGVMIAKTAQRKIVVASDRRDLNRTHVHLAIGGLQGADCDVVFLDCAPYPMLNYACRALDIPHAIMMTSAEAEDGTIGFRLTIDQNPIASFELKEMFEASRTAGFDAINGIGRLTEVDLRHGYLRWLMHGARPSGKPLSVLWDTGNGATSDIVTSLATMLPGRHVVINQGTESPLAARNIETTLRDFGDAVVAGGFDIGASFSGDGLGLVMVDDLGEPIREWHRLHILSTRRERQPIPGNGLLASRRKARGDIIKHALKVIQAISESGHSASFLRIEADQHPVVLGKGSVAPVFVGSNVMAGTTAQMNKE